jgi:serine/threonine protein kinase
MINKIIKDYCIKSELGQGGMATVYLAENQLLGNKIAFKLLNKEFIHHENIRKRFLAEARSMARMTHPNIIKVTDLIDEGETVAIVMEYVEGESLKEFIERKGKLSNQEIQSLFSQMLDALGYVHAQNLVHRDIKPSNFMVDPKGKVKLMDFGIAKTTDHTSAEYTQTGTGMQMGTPMYMSPEQITETKSVTSQSDIYSLGVVLWQMVTGKKPYDTKTISTFEMQSKIVSQNLPSTNTVFDTIIEKSTAKELINRYEKCKDIKIEIDNLFSEEGNHSNTFKVEESSHSHSYSEEDNEKTVIENVHKANNSKLPNKTNVKANLIYLVVGIVIIICLAIAIKNKNDAYMEQFMLDNESYMEESEESYEEEPASYEGETESYEEESYVETKTISFTNNSNYKAFLAYAYWNDGWESMGWYTIEPGNSYSFDLPESFNDDGIYWYAENSINQKWSGTDGYFCINNPNAFHYYTNENCDNQAGFYKLKLTGSYTSQTLSD